MGQRSRCCPPYSSALAPRFLAFTTRRRRRSLHIGDRPAHPLRVVAEVPEPQIARIAEQTPHDLALVIDAQLAFLLPTDPAAPTLSFPHRFLVIRRQAVSVLETRLVVAGAYLLSVFGIGLSLFPPGLVYFLLVPFPVVRVAREPLLSMVRVLRILFSAPILAHGHVRDRSANCVARARGACRGGTRRAQARTHG